MCSVPCCATTHGRSRRRRRSSASYDDAWQNNPGSVFRRWRNCGPRSKEHEFFGDGLAEEIINALAQAPGLKVAGRTSSFFFRGKDVEFGEIGRRLNVEHLLEGSVRTAGNRIRVTAQLVTVADGFHLWSERYDREMTNIFAIQDEITQAIAAALRMKLSPNDWATILPSRTTSVSAPNSHTLSAVSAVHGTYA